jgi:hypothetical protein
MPRLSEKSSCRLIIEDLQVVNESSCRSWRSRERLWSGVEQCPKPPAKLADLPNDSLNVSFEASKAGCGSLCTPKDQAAG